MGHNENGALASSSWEYQALYFKSGVWAPNWSMKQEYKLLFLCMFFFGRFDAKSFYRQEDLCIASLSCMMVIKVMIWVNYRIFVIRRECPRFAFVLFCCREIWDGDGDGWPSPLPSCRKERGPPSRGESLNCVARRLGIGISITDYRTLATGLGGFLSLLIGFHRDHDTKDDTNSHTPGPLFLRANLPPSHQRKPASSFFFSPGTSHLPTSNTSWLGISKCHQPFFLSPEVGSPPPGVVTTLSGTHISRRCLIRAKHGGFCWHRRTGQIRRLMIETPTRVNQGRPASLDDILERILQQPRLRSTWSVNAEFNDGVGSHWHGAIGARRGRPEPRLHSFFVADSFVILCTL